MSLINFSSSIKFRIAVLFVGFFCIFNSLAVTNQELMDRLDDIELEQNSREMNRLMDELVLQRRNQQRSAVVNKGCNASFYKVIYFNQADGVRACIFKDEIRKNVDNTIDFTYIVEAQKPSFYEGITYFNSRLHSEIKCRERKFRIYSAALLDNDFNVKKRVPLYQSKFEDYGKITNNIHKYLCD